MPGRMKHLLRIELIHIGSSGLASLTITPEEVAIRNVSWNFNVIIAWKKKLSFENIKNVQRF